MEQRLKVPMDRVAVIIGRSGRTREMLQEHSGCSRLHIDSKSGDVSISWGEPGSYDPLMALKMPDVIKAIGRGMNPNKAISLLEDGSLFELIEIKDFVGKRANQQRRMRSRIIGTDGKIRRRLEALSGAEIVIFGGTIVVIGDEEATPMATAAIQNLLGGAEHGPVLKHLERSRRRLRLSRRSLDYYETKGGETGFEHLVPGLAEVSKRRNRRFTGSQPDTESEEELAEMMTLTEDESIEWSEE